MGSNANQLQTFIASGSIAAFAFVENVPTAPPYGQGQTVQQGTANGPVIGVGPEYSVTTGNAIEVAVLGQFQRLQISSSFSGTGNQGDELISDASGFGTLRGVGGGKGQNIGAIATEQYVANQIILVQVVKYNVQPGDYNS